MNSLSDRERRELAEGCIPLCRKLGAEAARSVGRRAEARDFVAAACLAAVGAARRWVPGGPASFKTYAYKSILNAMHEARRGLDRATAIEDWGGVPQPDAGPGDAPAPAAPVDPAALTPLPRGVLDRLRGDTRVAVLLSVVEGASAEQIALRTGRSVKDVRLMLRNAAAVARRVLRGDAPAARTDRPRPATPDTATPREELRRPSASPKPPSSSRASPPRSPGARRRPAR